LRGSVNGFLRKVDQQILLLSPAAHGTYQNVYAARALGVEGNAGWTSPMEYVALDGNVTYLDFRNTSDKGSYGRFEGEHLPGRPSLFANGTARGQYRNLGRVGDELALNYYIRYVRDFYRFWEGPGSRESKDRVPSQLTHTLALIYSIAFGKLDLSTAIEAQNLSNARVYDQFGSQKPGRAFYFKLSFQR
jgi:outer membrane receptor for ferrienterochelin and colicin